jgi:outer membrane immunogenic protein
MLELARSPLRAKLRGGYATLRSAAVLIRLAPLAFIFVVLSPVAAMADAYPMPYATVTHESGTPPNVVSWGGYTAPGGRVYGPVIGFYNEEYAQRAGAILNGMAQAANACNYTLYLNWKEKWDALIEEAQRAATQATSNYFQTVSSTSPNGKSADELQALETAKNRAWHDLDQLRLFSPPEYRDCAQGTKQVGMVTPGPSIKLSGELGWGGSSNGFEDYRFSGNGVIGGISGQVNFPIGGGAYTGELGGGAFTGFGGSVLGSGVSGSKSDPITSNIRLLVPIDGIIGVTFAPNGGRWPLSLYGFGGLAIGDVNINASPFSATQTMGGWSVGLGADLQLSPNWSVGLKYRHFDLGNATFSVFPGGTSFVSERGDMVTGTLSYRFPIGAPALVPPVVTK